MVMSMVHYLNSESDVALLIDADLGTLLIDYILKNQSAD